LGEQIKMNETGRARSTCGRQENCIQGFCGGDLKERGHMQDLRVDARIILKWIFKKWDRGHGLDRDRWRAIANAVMNLPVT